MSADYASYLQYNRLGIGTQQVLQSASQYFEQRSLMPSGTKPVVICGGEINEAKDLDDAQRMAEESAHAKGKNAYILKPIKMIAPKRDVVTTDLP